MGGGAPHVLYQGAFRGRYDGLGSANNDDTNWIAAENTNWVQELDTKFRVRFHVYDEERFNDASMYTSLYYSYNGGTWTTTDGSSLLTNVASDDAGFVEASDTTAVLTPSVPTADYVTDNDGIVEAGIYSGTKTWPGAAGDGSTNDCDFEWCLSISSAQASAGDTLGIRVYRSDEVFTGGYDQDLVLTIGDNPLIVSSRLKIKGGTVAIRGGTIQLK